MTTRTDWMTSRNNLPGTLPALNLNAPDGSHFVDDDGDYFLLDGAYDVQTESRVDYDFEIDRGRRKVGIPWVIRVHFAGPTKMQAIANAQEVVAALWHQPGEFSITVIERETLLVFPYGCKARKFTWVKQDNRILWDAGRVSIDFEIQARPLPGHPFAPGATPVAV